MTPTEPTICPTCGSEMTLVFQNKRRRYTCEKCDGDPIKSPKVDTLLKAVQPPKE